MKIHDQRKQTLKAVISDYPDGACPVQLRNWANSLVGFPHNGEAAATVCDDLLRELREEGLVIEDAEGRVYTRA